MATTVNSTRRGVLKMIPATMALPVLAGLAQAAPGSEIQHLYAEWLTQKEVYDVAAVNFASVTNTARAAGLDPYAAETEYEAEFVDPLWDAMDKTELLIQDAPVETLADLAIKITVAFWVEEVFDADTIAALKADAKQALAASAKGVA